MYPKSKKKKEDEENDKESEEDKILPSFTPGEKGPHEPNLVEKKTQPPKYYTEATLLRAMETAGKSVDDEELRELMKTNGIGRPSTRAAIIETLFKRKYIKRRKKSILPTDTGAQLIDTINNKLLKSVEMTGQWEKLLRDIEAGTYNPKAFINHMKKMVDDLVTEVRMEKRRVTISAASNTETAAKNPKKKKTTVKKDLTELTCPKCKKGILLKGKTAYGCSQWKAGCDFRIPFKIYEKKVSENQLKRLVEKGYTTNLKGFVQNGQKTEGLIRFDDNFQLVLEPKKAKPTAFKKEGMPTCPKCKKGTLIRGKTAYGCTEWKNGCDFKFLFSDIKKKANGKAFTRDLVLEIISGKEY